MTTNNTNTTNQSTTTEAAPMYYIEENRKSEFVSMLSSTFHNNGESEMNSLVIAMGMLGSIDKLGLVSIDRWVKNVNKYIHRTGEQATTITATRDTLFGPVATVYQGFNIPDWFDVVVHADLITRQGEIGEKLIRMIKPKDKAYPRLVSDTREFARMHPMVPYHPTYKLASKVSSLAKIGLIAQQETPFMINRYMVGLGVDINKQFATDDQYVLDGCLKMLSEDNGARTSEFKGDHRVRTYQSMCHGPQFAASDESRSYMDLHGVDRKYNIKKAIQVIRDEMMDMIQGKTEKDLNHAIKELRECIVAGRETLVAYMVYQLQLKQHDAADTMPEGEQESLILSKIWSFVKANRYLVALEAGERPYIGMAFGLDAKCSGPQYGAILTGDISMAEACGFGAERARRDAYERAVDICVKRGIVGLTRAVIKTAFMGIFYGQGAMTFSTLSSYGPKPKQHNPRLLKIIQGISVDDVSDEERLVEQAKVFHAAIEASFGNMSALRKAIKAAHYHYEDIGGVPTRVYDTTEPTMYRMPDNTFVAMDYMVKVDIEGQEVTMMTPAADVTIDMANVGQMKFEKMSFKTKEVSLYDHARTGFVNMIQATDALVARHILSSLKVLGCVHAISVHDCFRVNINDFIEGKLHEAIKMAYKAVFVNMDGSGDILKNYFQGVKDAGGVFPKSSIAFSMSEGELKMNDWVDVEGIIDNLENKVEGHVGSYYFAK